MDREGNLHRDCSGKGARRGSLLSLLRRLSGRLLDLLHRGLRWGRRGRAAATCRRGRLAAGYALLALVSVPFLMFIVPRLLTTLHPQPVINSAGERDMAPRMFHVLMASLLGFTGLFCWLLAIEDRIEELLEEREIE